MNLALPGVGAFIADLLSDFISTMVIELIEGHEINITTLIAGTALAVVGGAVVFKAATKVLKKCKFLKKFLGNIKEGATKVLPNYKNAYINPSKLTDYALNPSHPVGGNKAKVFHSKLGFNQSNYKKLMKQVTTIYIP